MQKTDNEYLADMYKKYKPAPCRCGNPDSVFHPGRCEGHAEQDLSDEIDKHPIRSPGRRGRGSNLTHEDL